MITDEVWSLSDGEKAMYCYQLQEMIYMIHKLHKSRGWWDDLKYPAKKEALMSSGIAEDKAEEILSSLGITPAANRNIGELLALVHSEVSEAMEAARKNLKDDKLPNRSGLEVELADAVIRIFDMAGGLKLDLAGAIIDKLEYNSTRSDHSKKERLSENGKTF